ncbi:MAG: plasmid pRiA4b ORF-3 family protein [Thermomonas sp.]
MSTPLHAVPGKPAAKRAGRTGEVYQLRIDLRGSRKPKIWRRIVVPATIKLSLLHVVLLRAMGWGGGHMHEFTFAQGSYASVEPGLDLPFDVQDESRVSLRTALKGSLTFTWIYDYGDNWQHKVKVESADDMGFALNHPLCITGQGACPPDDVGGVPGFENFVQAMADPAHAEHDELTGWYGRPFDPVAFSAADVQERLDEIKL